MSRTVWGAYAVAMTAKLPLAHDLVRRAGRRQEYSAATKRALVVSARELFSQNGYVGTSLDGIVADARVTKGALYHHFKGKEAMLAAALYPVSESLLNGGRARVAQHAGDPESALVALVESGFGEGPCED